jgi:hypothetical protein
MEPSTQQKQKQDPQNQQGQQDSPRWNWQFTVAVGLLAAFAVLVAVMLSMADTRDETVWQRRVYLFGAAEAVVFTAVGWLFGREVHRQAAQSAQHDAHQAKQEAAAARNEAKERMGEAAEAERKATEESVRAKTIVAVIQHTEPEDETPRGGAARGGVSRDAGAPRDDGSATPGSTPTTSARVDMKALVRDLYP